MAVDSAKYAPTLLGSILNLCSLEPIEIPSAFFWVRVKEEMYSVGGTLAHEIVWIVYASFKFNLGSDAPSWFSIDG